MKTCSHWLDSTRLPRFEPLKQDLTVDVVVIGAGITGATAAYAFKKRGHRVALLERGGSGGVDTSCTTAHLTCVTDLRFHALVKAFGKEHARAVWDAGMASLDFITAHIRDEGIPCEFEWIDGCLHATPNEPQATDRKSLMKDARLARELGFDAEFVETTPYFTANGQFTITGFSGNGMTLGTIGAMMAVDAFEKRKNPWADLFSPKRKKLRGGTWTYLKENRDYPYYMVRDRLAGSEGKTLRVLKPGEGKILSLKGRKVAAYRDQDGKVNLCSPVCTHLKCVVAWNNAEKTRDCPCHGSRFTPTGQVLTGPAEKNLEPIKGAPTK